MKSSHSTLVLHFFMAQEDDLDEMADQAGTGTSALEEVVCCRRKMRPPTLAVVQA